LLPLFQFSHEGFTPTYVGESNTQDERSAHTGTYATMRLLYQYQLEY